MWQYAVILLILIVVGYWIFEPLLRPRQADSLSLDSEEQRVETLEQKKEGVYEAIKEMEFDFAMGKISKEDYEQLRSEYKARALEILKELDTLGEADDVNGAIEREVKELRAKKRWRGKRGGGKETVRKVNFCPNCGSKLTTESNFCPDCGVKLTVPGGSD